MAIAEMPTCAEQVRAGGRRGARPAGGRGRRRAGPSVRARGALARPGELWPLHRECIRRQARCPNRAARPQHWSRRGRGGDDALERGGVCRRRPPSCAPRGSPASARQGDGRRRCASAPVPCAMVRTLGTLGVAAGSSTAGDAEMCEVALQNAVPLLQRNARAFLVPQAWRRPGSTPAAGRSPQLVQCAAERRGLRHARGAPRRWRGNGRGVPSRAAAASGTDALPRSGPAREDSGVGGATA